MVTKKEAAKELLTRREARNSLAAYIRYTTPGYIATVFSSRVCHALDDFIKDLVAGLRPVLVFNAPPQSGKSEIVSRKLPAYLLGRYPNLRIAAASYSATLADAMSLDVRRNITGGAHLQLFPVKESNSRYARDTNREFSSPNGTGSYICDGVGGGFTGRAADIFIVDDPTRNAQEALSETTKNGQWEWYQAVLKTRLSANSGQILMATAWAQDDLRGRVLDLYAGNPRLIELKFPAINALTEIGYDPDLPLGALVPELHPIEQLLEIKAESSDYWWSALYQQSPQVLGGNVFKEEFVQYYQVPPEKFDKIVTSWDCTFKNTDGTDFVAGTVWGKVGANAYLLDTVHDRLSFSATVAAVVALHNKFPRSEILIEDKANGPAVIDTLKSHVPGIIAIEPDGSKLARAHAVTSYWEARNIWLPDPAIARWIKPFLAELTAFPAAAHDDWVDSLTQAIRRLYPLFGKLNISQAALNKAMGLGR